MLPQKEKNIILTVLNAYIVVSTVIIVIIGICSGAGQGQVGEDMINWGYLKAFTNLSNILAAVCAGTVLYFSIRNLKDGTDILPYGTVLLYYAGTSAVGLTFIIVVGFLGPMFESMGEGYFTMFSDDMFFFHFFNPVLCGISFVMLENKYVFRIRENFIAIIPTVIYSFVYAYMVVFARKWSDFYNFTFGGHFELTPVIMLAMYVISFLIALAQRKLHNRQAARAENS